MKPGEKARMWVKRSPLAMPIESAYEAPSEKPSAAMRVASIA
jgi:hypothetical protein